MLLLCKTSLSQKEDNNLNFSTMLVFCVAYDQIESNIKQYSILILIINKVVCQMNDLQKKISEAWTQGVKHY